MLCLADTEMTKSYTLTSDGQADGLTSVEMGTSFKVRKGAARGNGDLEPVVGEDNSSSTSSEDGDKETKATTPEPMVGMAEVVGKVLHTVHHDTNIGPNIETNMDIPVSIFKENMNIPL